MRKNIKLSIITINLNNKDGLEKTINSVVSQTFKDYEYIVIDGASSDGSCKIIQKYKNDITHWVSEKDSGVYNAMNKGIKVARGKYLQFLNSGDYLLNKEVLKKVFNIITNKDIYYGSSLRKSETGNLYEFTEPSDLSFKRFFDYSICHQSMFIKRKLFREFGTYDESLKIVSDWKFNVNAIILNNCPLNFLNFPIVFYDTKGISSKKRKLSTREKNNCMKNMIPPRILIDYIKNNINSDNDMNNFKYEILVLKNNLNIIQSSKFYKFWQSYNNILKKYKFKRAS